MTQSINHTDTEGVLKIVESLVEHVPPHIKLELDNLLKLLKSPLFCQYLDQQDLHKISQITDKTGSEDIGEICETVQKLRLSALEHCSNISTEECKHNFQGEPIGAAVVESDSTQQPPPAATFPAQYTTLPEYSTETTTPALRERDTELPAPAVSSQHTPLLQHSRTMSHRKISIHKETVVLESEAGEPLGFDVCGAVEQDNSGPVRVFVNKIIPTGLADRGGRLKEGDEIIGINEEMIDNNEGGSEGWQQILSKMSGTGNTGHISFMIKRKICVTVPLAEERDRTQEGPVQLGQPPQDQILAPPPPRSNSLSLIHRKLIFGTDGEVLKPMSVELVNSGLGLGFGIIDDVYGNVRVNTILADGPAHKEGTLFPRDVLLEINEAHVRGINQQNIAKLLKCASPSVSLVVGRPAPMEVQRCNMEVGDHSVIWEPLSRCTDTDGIKILEVQPDSDNYSVLRAGDVILQINDCDVERLTEEEIRELFSAVTTLPVLYTRPVTNTVNGPGAADQTVTQQEQRTEDMERVPEVWTSEIKYVEFEKNSKCLGISISPYKDPTTAGATVIVIDDVQAGSGLYDKIPLGSRLLSVNDKVFNDCSFEIVTKVLKLTANGPVQLGIAELAAPPTVLYCNELHKHISQSLITVRNNSDFPGITLKPSGQRLIPGYEVCSIISGGLFHVDGRIKTGDIIVSLNYADICHMTLANVRTLIRMSCQTNTLLRVSYVEKEETCLPYTVVVPRHPKTGIGICITGGTLGKDNQTLNDIVIKKIVDIKSPLKKGEQILKVNDMSMVGKTHDEAVEILKSATSPLTLTLQTPKKSSEAMLSTANEPETFDVVLPRTRDTLGVDIGTCDLGLVVTRVEENSVADVMNLKTGDVIFKVNGTLLKGMPQDMMLPVLRQQDGPTNVSVIRKPPRKSQVTPINSQPGTPVMAPKHDSAPLPTNPPNLTQDNLINCGAVSSFIVSIKKSGTTSLGINVVQRGGGIFVKNIVPDFPASQCSDLHPGDQILAVNGTPLTGMSRIKAIAVLRRVEGDVTLLLVRPTVTVTNVSSNSSDKENTPLQFRDFPPDIDYHEEENKSTKSSEPGDVPTLSQTLVRTDQITPDNLSLRSWNSADNRRSPAPNSRNGSYNSIDKVEYAEVELVRKSPARGSDKAPSLNQQGSIRSELSKSGSEKCKTPTSSVNGSSRSSPVLKRSKHDCSLRDSRDSLHSRDSVHSDRRISWHGSPIEVDKIHLSLQNIDSGSGVILISQPHAQGILVKSITPNSPSQQLVWGQDLITELNGQSTIDMPVSDAAILLSEKGARVELEIHRDSPQYEMVNVTLVKPKSGSLGLSITERRSLPGIYISQITPGGVAEKQELLRKGHRILAINGTNVKYMRQSEFIKILKECGSTVELVVGSPILDDSRSVLSSSVSSARHSFSPVRGAPDSFSPVRGALDTQPAPSQSPQHSPHSSHRSSPQLTRAHSQLSHHSQVSHHSDTLSHRSDTVSHHSDTLSHRSQVSHHSQVSHPSQVSHHSQVSHNSSHLSRQQSPQPSNQSSQRSFHSPTRSPHLSNRSPPRSPAGSFRSTSRRSDNFSQRSSQRSYQQNIDELPHRSYQDMDQASQRSYQMSQNLDQMSQRSTSQRSYQNQQNLDQRSGDNWSQPSYNMSQRSDHMSQRSDHMSQRSDHSFQRHPDPARSSNNSLRQSAHSYQSNRSRDHGHYEHAQSYQDMRSDSLQYSGKSLPSDGSVGGQTMSTHSMQSVDRRSQGSNYSNQGSNYSNPVYINPQQQPLENTSVPAFRTAYLYREKSTPLGLSIGGGRGWPLGSIPLFISSIQAGGLASRTGVLKEKDRIVSINGTNVDGFSHEDAVRLLKEATSPVTLVVTDPDSNRPNFKVVKLKRGLEGFGFSIVGGVNASPALPITVKAVYETGSAHGKLERGNQIISVNGKSIENYTREETTSLLKSCTETVTLVIQ